MGIQEREYTDDRVPVTDEEVFAPDTQGSDYTEESVEQLTDDIVGLINMEVGVISENTLLEESPVYDDELARENMENDYDESEH